MYEIVAFLAVFVFLYGAFAARLERTFIGGAITFTVIGLLMGKAGAGILELELSTRAIGVLAEITLAFLLFADAAEADLGELARQRILPGRMLLVGLPCVIAAGFLLGIPFFAFDLSIIEIALLASILAPTDAALGKAVISDESLPNRIRTTLNFESGLNDGLCVPIFLAFLAFATESAAGDGFGEIVLHLLFEELGVGALVGVLLSAIAFGIITFAERIESTGHGWRPLLVPALALTCYCFAQHVGGSGFIAAFVGGLVFGGLMKKRAHPYVVAAESLGDGAALLTWTVFGATVVASVIQKLTWEVLIYSALSLTIVRMLPIWLSLRYTDTHLYEALFLGWFGPRGLASIVFAIMAIDAGVQGGETISLVVGCTVTMSILAHGLTAKPFARWLAAKQSHEVKL